MAHVCLGPQFCGVPGHFAFPKSGPGDKDFNIMHSGAVQGNFLHIAGSFIEHAPATFLVCQYISIDTRTVLIQ